MIKEGQFSYLELGNVICIPRAVLDTFLVDPTKVGEETRLEERAIS
jgi:hypothetical protein